MSFEWQKNPSNVIRKNFLTEWVENIMLNVFAACLKHSRTGLVLPEATMFCSCGVGEFAATSNRLLDSSETHQQPSYPFNWQLKQSMTVAVETRPAQTVVMKPVNQDKKWVTAATMLACLFLSTRLRVITILHSCWRFAEQRSTEMFDLEFVTFFSCSCLLLLSKNLANFDSVKN